jgi:hypothetical protein
MALTLSSPVRCVADVASREIAGEAVLLHLAQGTYFGLNGVATRAWALLSGGASMAEVHAALLEEYEVEPDVLRADLVAWAEALLAHGLIEER